MRKKTVACSVQQTTAWLYTIYSIQHTDTSFDNCVKNDYLHDIDDVIMLLRKGEKVIMK